MRFKIGDRVRIKDGITVPSKLIPLLGEKTTIKTILKDRNIGFVYELEIDNGGSIWRETELEPAEKTYKTWEVIKMLTENPKLKFKKLDEPLTLAVGEDGYLVCKYGRTLGLNGNLCLLGNSKWRLIQEPVTWQEALSALKNQNTLIRVECPNCNPTHGSKSGVCYFNKKTGRSICIQAITEGTWYIEEGCEND